MSPSRQQQQQQQLAAARNDDTQQQPVVYTLLRQRRVYYESYCCRQSMCVGTMLLITGLLSVALQSVSIAAGLALSTICHGIWCGVMVSPSVSHSHWSHSAYTLSLSAMSCHVMSCHVVSFEEGLATTVSSLYKTFVMHHCLFKRRVTL